MNRREAISAAIFAMGLPLAVEEQRSVYVLRITKPLDVQHERLIQQQLEQVGAEHGIRFVVLPCWVEVV